MHFADFTDFLGHGLGDDQDESTKQQILSFSHGIGYCFAHRFNRTDYCMYEIVKGYRDFGFLYICAIDIYFNKYFTNHICWDVKERL